MLRFNIYLVGVLLLFLQSCSTETANNEAQSEAQIEDQPYHFQEGEFIHWEANIEGDYVIVKAWLNTNWNTYSIYNDNFPGPLPTLITFQENEGYELVGKIEEEGLKTKFDEESESEIGYFKDKAVFKQKIKAISGEEFVLKGNVNYMICNATTCLPPADYTFELAIKP